jgi:intracellular sulfur oxidation DsrE/DsrF family protein
MLLRVLVFASVFLVGQVSHAGPADFSPGPLIAEYGAVARVQGADPLPAGAEFRIVFDVSEAAEPGALNRRLESAARFLNMHAAAGVPEDNISIAIVVHGGASRDLRREAGEENLNAPLIAALIDHGVSIYLCGQTAAYYDIEPGDLLPGVRLSLSAMTAHALLQQQGYTLNPF